MIVSEIDEIEQYWNSLIFNICKGNVSDMKILKTYDVFDFFSYIENAIK